MATHARERLIDTAGALFFAEGIRAVGVERLLADSGIGRASFYRHFASKDDLVVAVLERRDTDWRRWLAAEVEARGRDPLALFDALADDAARGDFRGCAFINALAESADADGPVHRLAVAHKRAVTGFVAGLLAEAGQSGPEALARRFVLLMDGATVTVVRERDAAPLREARAIAAGLMA
ncbi:TetR/AcrR family transcriptional regulator [Streptomyces uncialis]|uniref:TetR family transcriptional regulator n=1 Tax=Streptomyces uncialis TaxID=1048205 RepID=A0A1Q4V5E5_9ACTN|nr:TetR/AcrR family transcriptional regulator [Streptomyces uncialis]OKH92979.1 TetR family transcriptional regulator [Streptomyces uncialis]